jgi:hypothetical protein
MTTSCDFRLATTATIIFLILLGQSVKTLAQPWHWVKNEVTKVLADTASKEKPRFIAYPTIAYTPETSWEFGISTLLIFHTKRDTTNRLSEFSAFTFMTLENQFGLWLDNALYSHRNRWFLLGRIRWQQFPLYFYGIGPETNANNKILVNSNSLLVRQRLLRQVKGKFYIGLETDFQRLSNVSTASEPAFFGFEGTRGLEGSTNYGLGLGMVYDTRHNILNVRDGLFAEIGFLRYAGALGSDFDFTSFFVESRVFRPIGEKQVFAAQLYGVFSQGDVPFNQLALMGGETLMRGYYTGRYRDRNYIGTQVEYRWLPLPFSRRFGATVFGGLGSVAPNIGEFNPKNIVWAAGAGGRFLIFPRKDVFTRVDVGFTREGSGVYFYIGEAF